MDYRYQEDIPAGPLRDSICSYGSLGPLLTLGDRIVWVLRDGPQFGWVRWVGRLPDVNEDGWTIGVEFDNAVGSGDGRFAGKRYFFGRQDRALFLPNTNLMRADEYHLQVARYDGFGNGNQKVVIPPYTTLPSRTDQFAMQPHHQQNGVDAEPQSEPHSANATPVQNKRSMFSAFKLKKSRSLQETVEGGGDIGYENIIGGNGAAVVSNRHDRTCREQREKSHFHLLPLRFPKSQSNSSVSSAPPNFGPPRIAGAEQDAENSSLSGDDVGLMSCLPSLGGSLLRRRKKDSGHHGTLAGGGSGSSINGGNGVTPRRSNKKKLKKRANEQTPAFAFLTTTPTTTTTTIQQDATSGPPVSSSANDAAGQNPFLSNGGTVIAPGPNSEGAMIVTAAAAGGRGGGGAGGADTICSNSAGGAGGVGSRQFAVLQQYRDSLEARSTPRLEKKLPHLANPQPGVSADVQLHRFESHSSTVVSNTSSQQVRHSRLSQLEQRRSLLTPIVPPEDYFDCLDVQNRRSNSLQITRNRSPIAAPGEPSSLPLPTTTASAASSDAHPHLVVKKLKKRKAPAPPPLELAATDSRLSVSASTPAGCQRGSSSAAVGGITSSYADYSSSSCGRSGSSTNNNNSIQRRLKKKAPLPPPPPPHTRLENDLRAPLSPPSTAETVADVGVTTSATVAAGRTTGVASPPVRSASAPTIPNVTIVKPQQSSDATAAADSSGSLQPPLPPAPESPRLNDLSRIDEDTESDFEFVLKRSDSKVNELVDAYHRLTESSGGDGDMSPEAKSDEGTLTPPIFAYDVIGHDSLGGGGSGGPAGSEASFSSSSTSTKWRYVDVSDSISVDSNTSEALAIGAAAVNAAGSNSNSSSTRRDSVSEYRLEFERRRAFYEAKNKGPGSATGRAGVSANVAAAAGALAHCSSSGCNVAGGSGLKRHSRSFEEPGTGASGIGLPLPPPGTAMSFRDILKSQSNSSIASKAGSTGSDKRPPIHPDSPTGTRQLLYKQLESAIARGEHDKAASLARQLALNKKKTSNITVNLYVEDKLFHVGPIKLSLNPLMTLRQLKQKIQNDYRFAEERQRWVIGSGLALDNERTLEELGVNRNDANLFLYLVNTAKYTSEQHPGTPKSLPKKFLDNFPSSIRHSLPENSKSRSAGVAVTATSVPGAASRLQRAESIDSDETWHTTAKLDNGSPASSSSAKVRKRRQIAKQPADQSVDKLDKLLKSQDTLKGWKCDLCGMMNRRAGLECVMCGSVNSATGNEADDELFEGSLDDIVNLDRLSISINKVQGDKISHELSPQPRDRLSAHQAMEATSSKPPISPKSRSVSQSPPPRSPVFAKALQPASMPVGVPEKRSLSPRQQRQLSAKSQIPRPIFVSDSSPSPPQPVTPRTPPSAEAVWYVNPSFESKAATGLEADLQLAVEEDFDISSDSGSDTASVTSFETNEKIFELDDGDEVGRITDELGLTDPNDVPSTSKERPVSVIYRPNGESQATNGFTDSPLRAERPTTVIFRPADVNKAFQVEGLRPVEVKHVIEDPPQCISETTLGAQPQRAVLHMETGARPKQANIVKLKTASPPPVPFKPLVTVQPWTARNEFRRHESKADSNSRQAFTVEVATTRNLFDEAKHTAELVNTKPHEIPETKAELKEAMETLRTLTESPVKDYLKLMQLDDHDLVANSEHFECPVCLIPVEPNEGAVLRDCLHMFCKDCLKNAVNFSTEPMVRCPFMNDEYSCESHLQEREIKALVSDDLFEKHLGRSMKQAETAAQNSFHCKTPDCPGWCFFEDNVNNFDCPVCTKKNCMTCQAIHHPLNCLQYQDQLELDAELTEDAKKTKAFLDDMVRCNDAMHCPQCRIILIRKWGCDWVTCSMCNTEICWVTKGPRWGPLGRGDTSGGCKCGVKGIKCHPKCKYCH